jgi:predicted O-linked N-acetylglucosamine transferase (SPINDLY family)
MSRERKEARTPLQRLLDFGEFGPAIRMAETLVAQSPGDADARLALARALIAAGQRPAALPHFDAAIGIDPERAPVWLEFADALWRNGERDASVEAAHRHLALAPESANGWFLLAEILLQANRSGEAEDAFARAIRIEPALIERRFELGQSAFHSKVFDVAAIHFHACTQARPDWLEALLQLGYALTWLGRIQAAYKVGLNAAAKAANDPRPLELQAFALERAGANPAQIIPLRMRVAQLAPQSWENQFLLAVASSRAGLYDLTQRALDTTLQLRPGFLPARWARFQTPLSAFYADDQAIQSYIDAWDQGVAELEHSQWKDPALRDRLEGMMLAQSNFYLGYTGIDVTSRQVRLGRMMGAIADAAFPRWRQVPARRPLRGRKLRVGFVTSTLRHHTVIKLFGHLMSGLPRDRHEVFAFGIGEGSDEVTESMRAKLDGVAVVNDGIGHIAGTIASAQLDALVHLDIGMHPRSASIGALRLAPFQAVLWGHPITTGLDSIDAFLTCSAMEPADGQSHYNERLLGLPHLGCWYDPTPLLERRAGHRRSERGERIRVVCAQSGPKLLPQMDELFARILAADPRIELDCLTGAPAMTLPILRERIFATMARHGVDAQTRVRVHGHVAETKFHEIAWDADFALDAVGWSGGVTAFETFLGDVPILSVPGSFMRGRHTYAMLKLMELPELIADDGDDLVAKALALAADPGERERLRQLISERKQRLYRDDGVIEAFASLLAQEAQRAVDKHG